MCIRDRSTPTQLIKIEGIWITAVLDESNRDHESQKLFAQELAIGTANLEAFFGKFPERREGYPFKEKRISHIVGASHAIEGVNLLELLQEKIPQRSIPTTSPSWLF